jgi:hypothetical protein
MTSEEKVDKAMAIINEYGHVEGHHHKQWCLDQIARILLGNKYEDWASGTEAGFEWDKGIAP